MSKYWIGGKSFDTCPWCYGAQVRSMSLRIAEAEAAVLVAMDEAEYDAYRKAEAEYDRWNARLSEFSEAEYVRWRARSIDAHVHQLHLDLGLDDF